MAAGRRSIIRRWETQVGIGIAVACFSVLGVFLGLKVGGKKPDVPAGITQVEETAPAEATVQTGAVTEAGPVTQVDAITRAEPVAEAETVVQTEPEEQVEEQPAGIPDMGETYQGELSQPSETYYEDEESEGVESALVQGPGGVKEEALEEPPMVAPSTDEALEGVQEEPPAVGFSPGGMVVAGGTTGDAAEEAAAVSYPKMHTVKPNETLMGIAKEYYGDVSKWVLIYDANGLTDRNILVVGQRLEIPSLDYAVKQQPMVRKASFSDTGSPGVAHRVQPGDTLQKLARAYYGDESQWKRIYDANKRYLSDGHTLKPGEVLIIP